MGFSPSPAAAAAKCAAVASGLAAVTPTATGAAALLVKTTIKALAPARLRGVGKSGRKLDVNYKVINRGEGEVAAIGNALGPWQLIERDTKAHRIPKPRGTRARTRYAVIPGVGVRMHANHPGTRGKHPWEKGVKAAAPGTQKVFETSVRGTFAAVF